MLRRIYSNQIRIGRFASSLVHVRKTETEGVSILSLNHAPVNSLNLETVQCLSKEVEALNNDKSCRGLILTSSVPKAFSAGVELTEFRNPDPERLREFWRAMQTMWMNFYSSRLPIVAAVNNHAIAGGCLLAVVCDRRVMAKGTIGLNESKLGLVLPPWLHDRFVDLVGRNEGDYGAQCGLLYNPNEALKIGLVDKLADEDDLIKVAKAELDKFLLVPESAFASTKLAPRRKKIKKFEKHFDQMVESFVEVVQNRECQNVIEKYIKSLKKPKK